MQTGPEVMVKLKTNDHGDMYVYIPLNPKFVIKRSDNGFSKKYGGAAAAL